ncbi:hypothetical protein ACFX13_011411 [Malus domestica]|uniref:Uncharacterized protein n=1 Tax=Malus domestica TaxID=3750 RepID=A0A498IB70_MALDO|nr:hypothetical protein DVH24_040559 [Malus domestica]
MLELDNTAPYDLEFPALPPLPLPPSPPPPPSLGPDLRKLDDSHREEVCIELTEDDSSTPPAPLGPSLSWEYWDLFGPSSPEHHKHDETVEPIEEKWGEARMEFEENEQEEQMVANVVNSSPKNLQFAEPIVGMYQ